MLGGGTQLVAETSRCLGVVLECFGFVKSPLSTLPTNCVMGEMWGLVFRYNSKEEYVLDKVCMGDVN